MNVLHQGALLLNAGNKILYNFTSIACRIPDVPQHDRDLEISTLPSAWPSLAHGFQGAHSLSVIPPNHPSLQPLLFASCRELYERVHGAHQRPL